MWILLNSDNIDFQEALNSEIIDFKIPMKLRMLFSVLPKALTVRRRSLPILRNKCLRFQ